MMKRKYNDEMYKFLYGIIPGNSYQFIADSFNEKFNTYNTNLFMTPIKVKAFCGNNGIRTGRKGYFPKGHVPHNKGVKGVCDERCKKTWFPKGHVPKNHKPIGSVRTDVDGYIMVKYAEGINKWEYKHKMVWREHYGEIPKGHMVIFLDGNKNNMDVDNLMCISKAVNCKLNQMNMKDLHPEAKKALIKLVELQLQTVAYKRRCKNGKRNGE